jgi:LytS/YehU family sensor histidine kinase
MSFSRTILYPILNLGSYSMGDPKIRFLMEYQKQFLIYCSVLIVFYLIPYYLENRARERKTADLELQAAQLRTRLAESQLNTLKGQLQPHFLFNTLNMISSIMYDDVEKADRMISRLSTLLRMSLENADQQLVPLLKELEFLDAYQQIMEARFEGRIVFSQNVEPELLSSQVPAFFLQPLVENSIKHNSEKSDNLNIQLEVKKQENKISVRLTDDGTGISGRFQKGFGLTNSEERLDQLYGDSYEMDYGRSPANGAIFSWRVFRRQRSEL